MPNLSDFTSIKKKVLHTILSDRECVDLITNDSDIRLPAESLLDKQVFLYDWIDDTVTEAKTFISVDVDVPYVDSIATANFDLFIYIAVHKSLMSMNGEIRRDALASRIDYLINGNLDFGFAKVELSNVSRFRQGKEFFGRTLVYRVHHYNRIGDKL